MNPDKGAQVMNPDKDDTVMNWRYCLVLSQRVNKNKQHKHIMMN